MDITAKHSKKGFEVMRVLFTESDMQENTGKTIRQFIHSPSQSK